MHSKSMIQEEISPTPWLFAAGPDGDNEWPRHKSVRATLKTDAPSYASRPACLKAFCSESPNFAAFFSRSPNFGMLFFLLRLH